MRSESDGLATVQTALANIKIEMGAVALPVIYERRLKWRPNKIPST